MHVVHLIPSWHILRFRMGEGSWLTSTCPQDRLSAFVFPKLDAFQPASVGNVLSSFLVSCTDLNLDICWHFVSIMLMQVVITSTFTSTVYTLRVAGLEPGLDCVFSLTLHL